MPQLTPLQFKLLPDEKSLDLTGSIPTELALLTHLALLDLSSSPNLEGTFPSSLWGRNMKLQALYLETTGLTGRLPQPSEGLSLTDLRLSSTPGIQQYGLPTAQFFQRMSHLKWFQWSQETGVKDDAAAAETFTEASSGTIPSELGLLTRLEGLSLGKHRRLEFGTNNNNSLHRFSFSSFQMAMASVALFPSK